jgi:hypothetical protein
VGPQGQQGASGASAWTDITGKPSTFTPSIHSHSLLDVTGLQDALAGKQPAGSYAAAVHAHTAGQVSGLATVATTGSYADLADKPTIPAATTTLPASSITGLATVATSGSYTDLANKPTIPAAVTSLPAASITGLATVATTGSYSDLANKPTIPAATTSASDLTSGTLDAARLPATVVLTSDGRLSDARAPTTHGHAITDVTGLQAALDGKQASGSFAAASHTHALSSLTQSGATTGQVAAWNGTAWTPATATGGGSGVSTYAATSAFPATGSSSTIYLTSAGRLYRWVSADSVYAEIGTIGGLADPIDGGTYA